MKSVLTNSWNEEHNTYDVFVRNSLIEHYFNGNT